ncbi:MAG: Flagellar hook protein FlgE [Syntrophorhabdus sp. PtaU1.Bin058]|nr:MAG: Flagellar hook protein FlgE [Syntrophorhabdus sp. PtaU1.Bin058]
MLSSFFSGISGLLANSHSINVVGNNIANVNTVGFKGSRATFEDVLYQSIFGSSGSSQVGRGTALSSVDTSFSQGSFESTSESTDLAIGGEGFFIVKSPDNNTSYYTRAGQFRFDKDGNLINPSGYKLQGREIDRTTNAPFGVDSDIVISPAPSEPRATEFIGISANLQSNADWKGSIGNRTTTAGTGNIIDIEGSEGRYARAGNYTSVITTRTADLTGTGTFSDCTGTLTINGVDVTLAADDLAGVVAAINAAAGLNVTASAAGGELRLTADSAGVDIVVDDSQVTTGSIGWTTDDKASTDLYGAHMDLTVDQMLDGVSQGTTTFGENISATGTTLTDWEGCGLNITYNTVTAGGTQTFAVNGFEEQYESATVNPSASSNYSTSITVYDSLGQSHVVTVYFRKSHETETPTQTSVWEWHAYLSADDAASGVEGSVQSGYLTFGNNGTLISGGNPISVSFDFSQNAQPAQVIDIVFGADSGGGTTTQYPIASTTNFQTQDGYPPGVLMNVTVSAEGVISGHYSNGQILDLYQITLANFNNPWGLRKEGSNLYSETLESGVAYTNAPGEGGLGKINPNSLEQSNVDLATEFVKMIIAQRGFQANSRVITTTDDILAELMNLKR